MDCTEIEQRGTSFFKWKFDRTIDMHFLTAAFLIAVVKAVIGTIAAGPLRDAAVVCLAGELSVITFIIRTHWTGQEIKN